MKYVWLHLLLIVIWTGLLSHDYSQENVTMMIVDGLAILFFIGCAGLAWNSTKHNSRSL